MLIELHLVFRSALNRIGFSKKKNKNQSSLYIANFYEFFIVNLNYVRLCIKIVFICFEQVIEGIIFPTFNL